MVSTNESKLSLNWKKTLTFYDQEKLTVIRLKEVYARVMDENISTKANIKIPGPNFSADLSLKKLTLLAKEIHMPWRMLKAPPLKSSGLYMSPPYHFS